VSHATFLLSVVTIEVRETLGMTAPVSHSSIDRDLLWFGAALGLMSGLVEGPGHMLLQRFDALDNSWYPIIWIASIFNAALLLALAIVASGVVRLLPQKRVRNAMLFGLVFAAFLPVFALILKEWIRYYAIAALLAGCTTAVCRWLIDHEGTAMRAARRAVPWLVAVTVVTIIVIQGSEWLLEWNGTRRLPEADPNAPDVALIIIDTLRSDHLSSYGYQRNTTPAIDRIASEGVLFERAFATSSYTLPSHESLLTGLYPHEHNVEWDTSHRGRNPNYATLPEVLLGRGYRTGAFSGNTNYFTREHGFGRGFLHFEDFFHSVTDMVMRTAYGRIVETQIVGRVGDLDVVGRKTAAESNVAALRWIARDPHRPYFIVINYMDAHDPYLPPAPFNQRFSAKHDGIGADKVSATGVTAPAHISSDIDRYDGSIAYIDDQLNQLVDALKGLRRNRRLLLIITSDHGEEFFEHDGSLHGRNLYRETLQVPLIVWQPDSVQGRLRISQPVSISAIPATVMAALGDDSGGLPGPPLQRLWEDGNDATPWPPPLAELKCRPWAPLDEEVRVGTLRSMVQNQWHYIDQDNVGTRLYDLANDPDERMDFGPGAVSLASSLADRYRRQRARPIG
jgi:arylsulfatase A-like enzyme